MRIKSGLYTALYLSLALPLLPGFIPDKHSPVSDSGKAVLLPSKFLNGERFYIKMPTVNGDTILGYCDTGSGICFAPPPALDKLNLQKKVKTGTINWFFRMKYISS